MEDIKIMKIDKKYRIFANEIIVKKSILYEAEARIAPPRYKLYYLQRLYIPLLRYVPTEFIDHAFQPVKLFSNFSLNEKERHHGNFIITVKPVKQVPYSNGTGCASEYRLNIFIQKVPSFENPVRIRKLLITDIKPKHPCIYENNLLRHYIYYENLTKREASA